VTVDAPVALPAQLYVERDAIVAARSAGTVDALFADIGTRVDAGAPLATIESTDQRIALERAEVALEDAASTAHRARALTRVGGVTGAESERTEIQLRQATLAVSAARRELALTRVTAPFAGVVSGRWARPRRLVAAGDTLFRVTESGPLLARVNVPEAPAASLRVGSAATVAGIGGSRADARVLRVAPAVDAGSGTREVVLRVVGGTALLPGSSVTVTIPGERRRVLAVPRAAVRDDGYVVVLQEGRALLRAVSVGADAGDGRVEVLGGLSAGERVARPAP
jgi:RND family efflux transporter MFP subunit